MGGTTFTQTVNVAEVNEAFQLGRDQAGHEHGYGGYTGTLAEKDGYVVIQRTPLPKSAAYALANKLINDSDERIDDKWGPAGAIPICAPASERVVKIRLTVDGEPPYQERDRLITEAAKAKAKPGEIVGSIGSGSCLPKGKRRVTVTEAGEGKVGIAWVIGGRSEPFPTKAKALAALRADPERYRSPYDTSPVISIRPVLLGDREASATTTVAAPRSLLEAEVALVTPGKATTGWMFFGWASC